MNAFEKERVLLSIGERIRKMRMVQDKTTKEIAAYLDISTQAYGNMERGKADISISRLVELAKFFGVPLLKMLTEDHFSAIIQFENNQLIAQNEFLEKKVGQNLT